MKHFALIGHPLGHTMSPPIHRRLFALSGQAGSYTAEDIPPERLAAELPRLRKELDGFNVTIPYKQKIIPFCIGLHETAERYGAVNVVDCRSGVGFNTDCVGFVRSLQGIPLEGQVLVCGSGGAGRMFAAESVRQGASVTLAVRESSLAAGQALADEIAEKIPQSRVRVLTYPQLAADKTRWRWLINGTPVGMWPDCGKMPVPPELLDRVDNIFDAIYNPARTLLMQEGEKRGCRVIGGMAMLVWQAAMAHIHWYGAKFDPEDIAGLIREAERMMEERP